MSLTTRSIGSALTVVALALALGSAAATVSPGDPTIGPRDHRSGAEIASSHHGI
jgi:hypothetical protein